MLKFIYEIYGGNNMNKEKLCCFYLNDIHLITMLLPYINKRINESTQIITILEKDISKSAKKVIDGIQGKKSKALLEVNWENKKVSYLYEADIKDKLILIMGSDNYINEANKIIDDRKENCKILNCYEMMQGSENLNEILDMHNKVVNTAGEKYPEEVFTGYTQKNYKKITL